MLKIKDNVDLKELEKFGFKEILDKHSHLVEFRKKENDYIEYNVAPDKVLYIAFVKSNNSYCYEELDTIFDLIQAGFLEKVVE